MRIKILFMPLIGITSLIFAGCESLGVHHSAGYCDPCCCCCCVDEDCESTDDDATTSAEPYDESPKPNKTAPPPPPEKETAQQTLEPSGDDPIQQILDDSFEQTADPNTFFEE